MIKPLFTNAIVFLIEQFFCWPLFYNLSQETSQSAPGSPVKGGCSGSLIFTVLSAPPLPQVHRVRGGEVCSKNPQGT